MIKSTFQGVNFELSMNIATYLSGRSFLKTQISLALSFMIVFSSKPGFLSSKSIMYVIPKELDPC